MEGSVVPAPTDIENPLETLRKELDSLSPLSPSRCIYRVPDRLRRVKEEAYTPHVISIGPFHHGKEALKAMEDHKKWYLKCVMNRTNLELNDYIKKIKEQEERLRSCYAETFEHKSDEFVKIILVDAIFVIEFLRRYPNRELQEREYDCIFGKPRMAEEVLTDMLMLENQLPFFILEVLDPASVGNLSIQFLRRRGAVAFGIMLDADSPNVEGQHFVDLLRKLSIAPLSKEPPMTKSRKSKTIPCIEKLHLAGVKFDFVRTTRLFDIRFEKGILKIPKLRTGDLTEHVLRNLIAFEQCSTSEDYCISDYVSILDELVDTPKDVELLVKYKIIDNDLGGGDHDLSSLINSLSTGLMYDSGKFYYGDLCGELDKFCSSKWHKWMANLRSNYFKTPWTTISFVAAVVLLILTAIQTICSIISLK
ncbi:UPF0481 protein [Rosa sericea]